MLVSAGLPIEDLDDRILLAGDKEIAGGFVNRDPFATVQIGVSVRPGLLEPPGLVRLAIGVESVNIVAVRVHAIDVPARIDSDASQFLEPLFAKSRALELEIVGAKRLALLIQRAGLRRRKYIREVEGLIGDQDRVVGRDSDVHNLATEDSVAELGEMRAGFDIPNLDAAVFSVSGVEQPGI